MSPQHLANLAIHVLAGTAGLLIGFTILGREKGTAQKSHWLRVSQELQAAAGADVGDLVSLEIRPVDEEPEPEVPTDFQEALSANPEAFEVWNDTTTIARVDWIHWIVSANQARIRDKRISDAIDKLGSGKKRVCCFDQSGVYSKALCAPKAAG